MLSNTLIAIGCIFGGIFGLMMSFYLALCFIQWFADVIEEKRWKDWRYWL